MEINWLTMLFTIVAFGLLYLLLNKYAFGPLFTIMEKRQELVKSQLDTAENNRLQSEKLLVEQKQAILDAKKSAFEILEQARHTSGRQAEDLIQAAKAETVRLKEEALKDIENEKDKAIAALRSQVSGLSVMIASKIIEKQVDAKTQEQLVEQYLKEVGGKQ
jgi:F-type H+-transporting ATPase subunit b